MLMNDCITKINFVTVDVVNEDLGQSVIEGVQISMLSTL